MLQDTSIIETKHKNFIEKAIQNGSVWALESEEGFATSESNDFEDAMIIPFWSDKAYAGALIGEDWSHYKATKISLLEFMENWLIGMYTDGALVGTDWDANLFGKEIEPLELALELVAELSAKKIGLKFTKFKNIEDYQNQVQELVDE